MFVKQFPFACDLQFGMTDRRVGAAEPDGERQFDTCLPFLEIAVEQVGNGVIKGTGSSIRKQSLPETAPAVTASQI